MIPIEDSIIQFIFPLSAKIRNDPGATPGIVYMSTVLVHGHVAQPIFNSISYTKQGDQSASK